ncbi:hypothetical protein C4568_04795, partial [Candidatus Parcubacteria bacterium]
MSDEIFFDGVQYTSAAFAAREVARTRDYIARLCKDGKVRGKRVGKNWYVHLAELKSFLVEQERAIAERREEMSRERAREYQQYKIVEEGAGPQYIDGATYLPASEAAESTGLTRDYVGRLCREKKIAGLLAGNIWYVDMRSLQSFLVTQEYEKNKRHQELAHERAHEYKKNSARRNFGALAQFENTFSREHNFRDRKNISARSEPRVYEVPAAASTLSRSREIPSVAGYAPAPVSRMLSRLVTSALIIVLVFGTYALVEPESAREAIQYAFDNKSNVAFRSVPAVHQVPEAPKAAAVEALAAPSVEKPAVAPESQQAHAGGHANFLSGVVSHVREAFASIFSPFAARPAQDPGKVAVSLAPYPTERTVVNNTTYNTYNTNNVTNNNGGDTYYTTNTPGGATFAPPGPSNVVNNNYSYYRDYITTNEVDSDAFLAISGGTLTGLLNISASGTSTFAGGLSLNSIDVTGSGTSTFANGVNIADGCFAIDGNCIASGSGISAGGSNGQIQFNSAGTVDGASDLFYNNATGYLGLGTTTPGARLSIAAENGDSTLFNIASSSTNIFTVNTSGITFTNATGNSITTTSFSSSYSTSTVFHSSTSTIDVISIGTTTSNAALTLDGAAYIANITAPSVTTNRLYATGGDLYWNGSILNSGGGGGSDINWSYFNNSGIRLATTTNQVLIGASATSTNSKLEVVGGATFDSATSTNFYSSSLTAGNATSTNLFATFASTSNLFSNAATIGTLLGGAGTFSSTLSVTGLTMLTGGYLSLASSTVVGDFTTTGSTLLNGSLTVNGTNIFNGASSFVGLGTFSNGFVSQASSTVVGLLNSTSASTSRFTNSGSTWLTGLTNALLATDANGLVVATSSISTNSLTGILGVGNGGTGASAFGQGWIYSTGGTNALAASTSPTVNYLVATSSSQGSIFAYRVGIGGSGAPTRPLDVTGAGRFTGTLTLGTVLSCTGSQALQTNGSGDIACGTLSVSGASSAGGWTTNNNWLVSLSTSTDLVSIGGSSTPYGKVTILSDSTATTTLVLSAASAQTANIFDIYDESGSLSTVLTAGGLLGLGTSSPATMLSVGGSGYLTGGLGVGILNTSAGTLRTSGAATFGGLGTFSSGFISNASSTISSGLFSMTGGASTTAFTNSGSTWLSGLTNAILSTDQNGLVVSTSTIGLLGLNASTARFTNATTTNLHITGLTNALLGTDANGRVVSTTSISTGLLTGILGMANGGTGTSTWQTNSIPYFNGTRFTESTGLTYNGTALTATFASSTYLTATTATSTNIFANAATIGTFSGGTGAFSSTLAVTGVSTFTGLGTFTNGFVSQASSSVVGLFNATRATTTQFTNTGSTWLTGLTSALLSTDQNGLLVSTTTIGLLGLNVTNATTTSFAITNLTSGRVPFVTTGGSLRDSSAFLFNNTTSRLTVTNASTTAFSVSGNAYFPGSGIWNSSGNVGIGTTSPDTELMVHGGSGASSVRISGRYDGLTSFTDTRPVVYLEEPSSGGVASFQIATGDTYLGSVSSNSVNLVTGNTSRLTITSGGDVAIGSGITPATLFANTATNPTDGESTGGNASALTWRVAGAGYAGTFTNTGGHGLLIKTSDDTEATRILVLNANNADKLVVLGNGNLGLGSSTPFHKLAVGGSSFFGGNVTATGTVTLSALTNAILSTDSNGLVVSTSTIGLSSLTASAATFTNATTTSLAISNLTSGRVPFVTTGGSLRDSSSLLFDSALSRLTVTNASTTALSVSGTAYFPGSGIWNSSGLVGIGTTSPVGKLEVAAGSDSTDLLRLAVGNTYLYAGANATNNYAALGAYNAASGARPLVLQSAGGNVGIGTTTPQSLLHTEISGTGSGFLFTDSDAQGGKLELLEGGSGAGKFQPSIVAKSIGSDRAFALYPTILSADDTGTNPVMVFNARLDTIAAVATRPLYQWTNNASPVMTISATGNVGIGTTSPGSTQRLAVGGNAWIGGNLSATGTLA